MRKTYRITIESFFMGTVFRVGDVIDLNDREHRLFEAQNIKGALGEILSEKINLGGVAIDVRQDPKKEKPKKSKKKVKEITKVGSSDEEITKF